MTLDRQRAAAMPRRLDGTFSGSGRRPNRRPDLLRAAQESERIGPGDSGGGAETHDFGPVHKQEEERLRGDGAGTGEEMHFRGRLGIYQGNWGGRRKVARLREGPTN